ncbi:unnamed protein product [Pleuronectes platessa]|uniref:Uncharacterized protein n=1 Tax=Pleuronectes platessa TaxID=8262 RepID=A0A9N7UY86_PLEPL|nr:unnamed protein product [Pleuronectes platessa]
MSVSLKRKNKMAMNRSDHRRRRGGLQRGGGQAAATTWYGSCTALNRKALQRVVKSAPAHHHDGTTIHEGHLHPAV